MTVSFDLWVNAGKETEDALLAQREALAVEALSDVFAFTKTTSRSDFANRMALVEDRIDKVVASVTEGDPAGFAVLRARVAELIERESLQVTSKKVEVYLNETVDEDGRPTGFLMGYREGDTMRLAISYEDDGDDMEIAARAFEEFNIGTGPLAQEYRAGGNRSLSVGDLVKIDGVAYSVEPFGWERRAKKEAQSTTPERRTVNGMTFLVWPYYDRAGKTVYQHGGLVKHPECGAQISYESLGPMESYMERHSTPGAFSACRLLSEATASLRKGAPFAGYESFEACVAANQDADDPEAYCGSIKHKVEDSKESQRKTAGDWTSPSGLVWAQRADIFGAGATTQMGDLTLTVSTVMGLDEDDEYPFAWFIERDGEELAQGSESTAEAAAQEAEAEARGLVQTSRKKADLDPVAVGVKVGDIFVSSWGYDQTNVDFYEVTRLLPASVELRQIGATSTETGFMSGTTVPKPGVFIGEPFVKRMSTGWQGEPWINLTSYSGASLWDGTPERFSSYASRTRKKAEALPTGPYRVEAQDAGSLGWTTYQRATAEEAQALALELWERAGLELRQIIVSGPEGEIQRFAKRKTALTDADFAMRELEDAARDQARTLGRTPFDPAVHGPLLRPFVEQAVYSMTSVFNSVIDAADDYNFAADENAHAFAFDVAQAYERELRLQGLARRKTAAVSRSDAEKVLKAVEQAFASYVEGSGYRPTLDMNWDFIGTGAMAAIHWEEGPYEWAYEFPYGGIDQEFGYQIPDVSASIPGGVFIEPITSWAIGLYPNTTASRKAKRKTALVGDWREFTLYGHHHWGLRDSEGFDIGEVIDMGDYYAWATFDEGDSRAAEGKASTLEEAQRQVELHAIPFPGQDPLPFAARRKTAAQGQQFRVTKPGAGLWVKVFDRGGMREKFIPLAVGDIITEAGSEYSGGSDGISETAFEFNGQQGVFSRSSWGSPNMSFLEPVTGRKRGRSTRKTASKRYETAKAVVESKQAQKIEGTTLDTTSAQALITVYEALSADNQAKFDSIPLDKLMEFVWSKVSHRIARQRGARKTASSDWMEFLEIVDYTYGPIPTGERGFWVIGPNGHRVHDTPFGTRQEAAAWAKKNWERFVPTTSSKMASDQYSFWATTPGTAGIAPGFENKTYKPYKYHGGEPRNWGVVIDPDDLDNGWMAEGLTAEEAFESANRWNANPMLAPDHSQFHDPTMFGLIGRRQSRLD